VRTNRRTGQLHNQQKKEKPVFVVIHPLDDTNEEKLDVSKLGPMKMTTSVKISLYALRGYLIFMLSVVAYRVVTLALAKHM